MIAPAAMFIESAQDKLKDATLCPDQSVQLYESQAKEIRSAVPNRTEDFYEGYALGVETARVLLMGMPAAVKAGVRL